MKKYSVFLIIIANIVPILGVLFLDWTLFSIMFFYWLESAIVGIFNIPKILKAKISGTEESIDSDQSTKKGRLFIIGFFIFHYGMFMFVHGLFIFDLFGPPNLTLNTILLGITALAISHGLSFKFNFLDHKEYEKVTIKQQMFAPYKRIVIMHITIFICGLILAIINAPVFALIILILLKIAIDITAHLREHSKLGTFANLRLFGP